MEIKKNSMAARRRLTDLQQLITDIHTNNINYINREVYLHGYYDGSGEVSEEPGVEYRMATTFVKNLNILQGDDKSPILVHLHTVGGNWQDGIAIYNAMQYSEAPITILAYAECSSMSGIILQAADRRILMPDTTVMIHHGSLGLDTTSIAAKSIVDINEKCCKKMLKIFAKRALHGQFFKERQYSMSKIESYIDRKIKDKGDWFLSAEEAVYYGIADGIFGSAGYENVNKIRTTKKIKW